LSSAAVDVSFRLLGPVEAVRGEEALDIGGPKSRALLAYLLLRRGELVSLERLIDELWDEPPPTAAKIVRLYVSRLRKAFDDGSGAVVVTRPAGYELRLGDALLDLEAFQAKVSAASQVAPRSAAGLLREALALWRGPALADLDSETFVEAERERLEELRLAALEARIDADLACGRDVELIPELAALTAEHPLREHLPARSMLALYRSGRQAEALEVYRRTREKLVEERGIEPGPELRRLEQRILRQDPELELRTRRRRRPPPTNLPVEKAGLIGREHELRELTALLHAPGVRLLTLTGAGGTGKTRLALRLAAQALPSVPDGAFLVELAPIGDPALLAASIARTLGVAESGAAGPLDHLEDFLRERRLLLLLDSFEHLVHAAPLVAELLASAPGLKVLVTSRAPLRLSGEHEYPVRPLALPEAGALPDAQQLGRFAAVQLFAERARAVQPGFVISEANAADVSAICVRLDGLPLALELAAARVKLLSPRDLLARLERPFEVLRGGARDLSPRHRTLERTIEWSYDLLTPPQQALFLRLSVFAGGCTVQAAEAVCNPQGELGLSTLDGLGALVDESLAETRQALEPELRFSMLDTVREYAAERLEAGDDGSRIRERHLQYYVALAEAAEPGLEGPEQSASLTGLEAEHDNFRAALDFCRGEGKAELELRLAAALARFWYLHNHLREGSGRLESALARCGGGPPALRAAALSGAALLASRQGQHERAKAFWEESLTLFRRLKDGLGTARCLNNLGNMAVWEGDYERAQALFEQSRKLARGDGGTWVLAAATNNLGDLALTVGEFEQADALFEESLELHRELAEPEGIAISLLNLGFVALERDERSEACRFFDECVVLGRELGDREVIVVCLEGFAAVAAASGEMRRAGRLVGAAAALREEIDYSLGPFERTVHERTIAALAAALGPEQRAAAERSGRKLSMVEALDAAGEIARPAAGKTSYY
jgi:predicted ATPase/DNA-binding SARP family transcriptional activator